MTTTTTTPDRRDLNAWEVDHLQHRREQFAGINELLDEVNLLEATFLAQPAPGPCPAWCDQREGHGWVDSDDRADIGRFHSRDFGKNAEFHVCQFESVDTDGIGTTLLTAEVLPPLDAMKSMTNPLDVIDVGLAAINAANLLRRIHEGTADEVFA